MSGTDTQSAPKVGAGSRQARLYLTRLDPWTVMKTAFVLSIGLAIVMVVATFLLWMLLSVTGTFDSINSTISDLGGSGSTGVDVAGVLSFGRIMGFALLLSAFEIVLTSALATVTAAIYNITVGFTGGVEVTLSEEH
ncbi:MAG: DUF3566 domain-containing protein [Actinobacteria bacterium]|nr:DUF3566 domain-containing protein [Actinomycetota bacterium]